MAWEALSCSGRIGAWIYGPALSILGWTIEAANIVSASLVFLALACLFPFLRHLGLTQPQSLTFLAVFSLWDPVMVMANQARYEPLVLLFCAAALLLYARDQFCLAGVLATLAIEVHPIGVVGWVYLASAELHRRQTYGAENWGRRLVSAGLGGALGSVLFVAIHPDFMAHIPALLGEVTPKYNLHPPDFQGHFLEPVFLKYKFFRHFLAHLPQAILFIVVIVWHLRQRLPMAVFGASAALGVFLVGRIYDRPNKYYAVFWFFPMILLTAQMLWNRWSCRSIFGLVFIFFVPQYVIHAWENSRSGSAVFLPELARVVDENIPNNVPIYGQYMAWLPLKDREFRWIGILPELACGSKYCADLCRKS